MLLPPSTAPLAPRGCPQPSACLPLTSRVPLAPFIAAPRREAEEPAIRRIAGLGFVDLTPCKHDVEVLRRSPELTWGSVI